MFSEEKISGRECQQANEIRKNRIFYSLFPSLKDKTLNLYLDKVREFKLSCISLLTRLQRELISQLPQKRVLYMRV